jgi:hypothetical protein
VGFRSGEDTGRSSVSASIVIRDVMVQEAVPR